MANRDLQRLGMKRSQRIVSWWWFLVVLHGGMIFRYQPTQENHFRPWFLSISSEQVIETGEVKNPRYHCNPARSPGPKSFKCLVGPTFVKSHETHS